jgi:hypothetical protein
MKTRLYLILFYLFVQLLPGEGHAQIAKSAFIVNTLGENLSVINLENKQVNKDAKNLGRYTNQIVIRKNFGYVINSGVNEVEVINLASLSTIRRIDVGTGTNPYGMDFVNDSVAVISLLIKNQVLFADVKNDKIIKTVSVENGPQGVKYAFGKVYVANSGFNGSGYDPGLVSVIDLDGHRISDIPVGTNPQALDVTTHGKIVVACTGDYGSIRPQLNIIDTKTDTVEFSLTLDLFITNVRINSDNIAYLATFGSGVMVYDLDKKVFIRDVSNTLPGGPDIAFDVDKNAYICDFENDSVYTYNPNNQRLNGYLVGDGPVSIAVYDPQVVITTDSVIYFKLNQNYPNPFNPVTYITFSLPHEEMVKLDLYNLLGVRIQTLIDQQLPEGKYTLTWDGKNDSGTPLSSGVYFYRLKTSRNIEIKKMHLVR